MLECVQHVVSVAHARTRDNPATDWTHQAAHGAPNDSRKCVIIPRKVGFE